MKKKRLLTCVFGLLMFASNANALTCGGGKVTKVLEGGWNTDSFAIQIDYSAGASAHPGTENSGFIIYKNTLNASRLSGVRAMALAAYSTGKPVYAYSHNNNCSDATELQLIN